MGEAWLTTKTHHAKESRMSDPDLTVDSTIPADLRAWLLAELRYPVLAVNSASGAPSQSVMWFDLDPDDLT